MKHYLVTDRTTVSGNPSKPGLMDGEVVDADWVRRYMDIDTRRFFINLGGVEEFSKSKSGVIRCKSTSPDRRTTRIMRFSPHPPPCEKCERTDHRTDDCEAYWEAELDWRDDEEVGRR